MKIKILSESIGEVVAELTDENPRTAQRFFDALPLKGKATLWGDEIYFVVPITAEKEHSRIIVQEGELAIWVEEPSLCIFFGKTPASTDSEIRAYSEVNVIGKIIGDASVFKKVKNGERITVERFPDTT